MVYTTYSDQETQELAEKLADKFKNRGGVITLKGDLGAGKTTFVKGLAKGLGIKNRILSPTFVLIRQYQIPGEERLLVHSDLYRLKDNQNLAEVGLSDYLHFPQHIVVIEWPEKLSIIPEVTLNVSFSKTTGNARTITIEDYGNA